MNPKDEFISFQSQQNDKLTFAVNSYGHITHIVKRVDLRLYDVFWRLQKIRCINLPIIIDLVKQADYLEVHEEYIRGRTVEQLRKETGTLDDAALLAIAMDVCHALAAIHGTEPPIVHRDIKPENIMEREYGGYVLIDFDAARIYREDASTDTKCIATVGYAAPEQYGLSQTDVRSDLFSLGVTLYELKTGEAYHVGAKCDGLLKSVIAKCTAFEPNKRYNSAQQLLRRLEALQPRNRRRSFRKRLCGAALFCAVTAALVFAICFGILNGETPTTPILAPSAMESSNLNATQNAAAYDFTNTQLTTQNGLIIPFINNEPVTTQLALANEANSLLNDETLILLGCRIDGMSIGANAEVTDDGKLTIYTEGAYFISAIAKSGKQTSGLLEALVIATDTPAAYTECKCVFDENKTRPVFKGNQFLPENGELLYLELRVEPICDDRICTAAEHKEAFYMMGSVDAMPDGANCGVTEDNMFYTDTAGTYQVSLPFVINGQYYRWGAQIVIESTNKQ